MKNRKFSKHQNPKGYTVIGRDTLGRFSSIRSAIRNAGYRITAIRQPDHMRKMSERS